MSKAEGIRRLIGRAVPAITVCGLAAALAWSGALSSPEGLLGRSFETAMAKTEAGTGSFTVTPVATATGTDAKPVNAVWPGGSGQTFALRQPLTLGDHITISSSSGRPEKLSVVGLAAIDGATIGAPGVQFQMVTSRTDGANPTFVRFLIAIEPPAQRADTNKTL